MIKRTVLLQLIILLGAMQQNFARESKFIIDADALYWRAAVNGLSYGIESEGSTLNPSFDWDFGFRLGFGYVIPHDEWNLSLGLTHFNTHTYADHSADIIYPVWQVPTSTTTFIEDAKMHWRLHFALLDLGLEKQFYATDTLSLTPILNVRYACIRQKYHLQYFGGNLTADVLEMRTKNKFWGIGPKIGGKSEWLCWKEFSLYADMAASLLYGQIYLHQDEYQDVKLLGIHDVYNCVMPIAEWGAGIRWSHRFKKGLKQFSIDLGWDQLDLFSQNQLLRFLSNNPKGLFIGNQGDVTLYGLQLGFHFQF